MLRTAREIKEGLNRDLLAGCEAVRISSVATQQQLREAMLDRSRRDKSNPPLQLYPWLCFTVLKEGLSERTSNNLAMVFFVMCGILK